MSDGLNEALRESLRQRISGLGHEIADGVFDAEASLKAAPREPAKPALTDAQFRAFLNLLMASDPWPAGSDDEGTLHALAIIESRVRGFNGWIDAFHRFNPEVRRYTLTVRDADGGNPEVTSDLNLTEFFAANTLDPKQVCAISALAIGEEFLAGGGAAPLWAIRRDQ